MRNVPAESRVNIGSRTYVAHSDADEPASIRVSHDGKHTAHTRIAGSAYAGDAGRNPMPSRAELSAHLLPFSAASQIWSAFSICVRDEVAWDYLFQLHFLPGLGDVAADPPVALQLIGTPYGKTRELSLVTRSSAASPLASNPAPVTRWTKPTSLDLGTLHRVVMQFIPGPSGDGGLGFWFDGGQAHDPAVAIALSYASAAGIFEKCGGYGDDESHERLVEIYNLEVGTADLSDRILNPLPLP
jgi:hypothetical protein